MNIAKLRKPDGRGYLYNMTFSKCKIIERKKPVYLYFRCLSNLSDVGKETGAVLMQHWKWKKSEQTACKHFNILQRCGLTGLC